MAAVIIFGVLALGTVGYLWFKGNRGPLAALKGGEYGHAAIYREWRLAAEQQEANSKGNYGLSHFSRET
jgi:hypothetical protein